MVQVRKSPVRPEDNDVRVAKGLLCAFNGFAAMVSQGAKC